MWHLRAWFSGVLGNVSLTNLVIFEIFSSFNDSVKMGKNRGVLVWVSGEPGKNGRGTENFQCLQGCCWIPERRMGSVESNGKESSSDMEVPELDDLIPSSW